MKKASAEVIVLRSILLGAVLGFVGSALHLVGCVTIPQSTIDAVMSLTNQQAAAETVQTNTPTVVPDVAPATVTQQSLWDAVSVNWMVHGEGTQENEIRAAAIKQASAEGKAIRFKFRYTGTDLRFWLLWWESDKDKGKFPQGDMATPSALRAGVVRWVVDANDCDIDLVVDTFKAYGDPDHQLQFVNPSPELVQRLGLDSNGVKISPPTYRK